MAAYLFSALPLAAFLYVNTFADAWTFFAGHAESPLVKHPWIFVLVAALPSAALLADRRWMVVVWLAVATTVSFLIASDRLAWGRVTAYALCLPGWVALADWAPQLWRAAGKPAGELKVWVRAGLLAIGAAVISSVAHAVYLLRFAPNLNLSLQQSSYVLPRVAAITTLAILAGLVPFAVLCIAVRRSRQGSRILLLVLGLGAGGAAALIMIHGFRRLDGLHAKLSHVAFATAVVVPLVVCFLNRVATIRGTVGEGLISFGRRQADVEGRWKRIVESHPFLFSILYGLLWLGVFIVTHMFIGKAQLYYGWGSVTAPFYGSVALGVTWYLLTRLSRRTQNAIGAPIFVLAAVGLLTLGPWWSNPPLWTGYLKFDQNVGGAVRLYYEQYPRRDRELAIIRERLAASRDKAVGHDLRQWHLQTLSRSEPGRRTWVFFIVADALRHDTYSGSRADRRKFPGMDWMADRFVIYDNTWTSYNGTSGSLPAYLNGMLHPAWYRMTADDQVQHDNLLVRGCQLASYACYNLGGYMPEFHSFWPPESTVPLPKSGIGMGDPGALFPVVLETVDQHRRGDAAAPAFFYVHLYNLHQPLLLRPGVPYEDRGLHWMRALYEHNARHFDQQLLMFLKGLEQRGLLESSLVIVTSDHGEEFFDLGGLYHGWHMNPAVMHVPLFVHYPRGQTNVPAPGAISQRVVNLIDLAPTICEAMGVSIKRESALQGVSLLSANEPTNRIFPLLNWCSPVVGDLSFSPPRMRVLNCESGVMDVFEPGAEGWRLQTQSADPLEFARGVETELEELFQFWQAGQSNETSGITVMVK